MTTSNFKPAFKVDVQHTWFKQNICTCLQFNPGPVTQKLISRFNFCIANKINGFDLYSNSRQALPDLLKYIASATGQTFFDFEIVTNNPEFNSFTDVPLDWLGQIIYNSNDSENIYQDGAVLLNASLSKNVNSACIGTLTVQFNDVVKYVASDGYAQFNISYKARSTQWQYFVINRSSLHLDNPAITGKTGIGFTGPENVTMENGQRAILFSSGDNLIPLSEVPEYKFNLVNNQALNSGQTSSKPGAAKVIFKGLPNPDPKRIGIVQVNSNNLVSSPMYVYV